MARPEKTNADYFSHDNDMRNDEKIKAVRNKFRMEGYGIWCMLLEKLCKANGFKLEYSDLNIELWGGDFDVDPDKIKEVIEYFIKIHLISLEGNMIFSEKFIKRFEGLFSKRERQKKWLSTKETGENEVIDVDNKVKDVDNTQRKGKEIKGKEIKGKISKDISITSSNEEVMMQKFLRQAVGLSKFKDKEEDKVVKQCHDLMKEIGKEEFGYRLKTILEEPFKAKNCNKLEFLYGELASFIHSPVVKPKGQGQKVSPNKY